MARLKIVGNKDLIIIFSSSTPPNRTGHQQHSPDSEDPLQHGPPHQIRCAKKKVVSKMRWKLLPQTFQVDNFSNLDFVQCFFREHLRTAGTKLITSATKCHVIFIAGLLNEHSDSDLSTKNSENGCPKTSFKLHYKCGTKLLWMLRRVML